jgi:hypothetical protein
VGVKPISGTSPPNAAPIQARIDTLVLRGFPSVDANRLQAAFATELDARLQSLAPAMNTWTSRDLDRVSSIRIQVAQNSRPEALGRHIARAVVRALTSRPDEER